MLVISCFGKLPMQNFILHRYYGQTLKKKICMMPFITIRKEKDDLERLANRLIKSKKQVLIKKITLLFTLFVSFTSLAQRDLPLDPSIQYELADINVTGTSTYNENTVIAFTGLRVGEKLYLPGEKISNVIKKLWGCLLYTSPSPRDRTRSRMPSSA